MERKKIRRPQFFEIGEEHTLQLAAMVQGLDISFVPSQVTHYGPHRMELEKYKTKVRAGLLRSVLEAGYGESPAYLGLVIMDDPTGDSEIIGAYLSREAAEDEADRTYSGDMPTGIIETTPSLLQQGVGFFAPTTWTVPNPLVYQILDAQADAGIETKGPHPEVKSGEPGECRQTSISAWHRGFDYREKYIDRAYAKLAETMMRVELEVAPENTLETTIEKSQISE